MKHSILSISILFLASIAYAEPDCLRYNQDGIILTGRMVLQTFFGPPNYGENPETDSKETQALLKLDKPICVSKDRKNYEEAESSQTEVTLVPIGKINFNQYAEKHIRVSGSLFHSFTGHHHTSVLISVTEQPSVVE